METEQYNMMTVEDFLTARNNTVGGTQFEYDYNLNVTTAIMRVNGPSAKTAGNVKYNSDAENKYLRTAVNSGALISDGTVYTLLQGANLETFKVNKAGTLCKHKSETVASDFKYESSSYAKLLFTADTSNIDSLSKVGENDLKYRITLPTKAGIISASLSKLKNPLFSRFLMISDSSGTVNMYVTFDDTTGNIKKYEYDFEIAVTSITTIAVKFHYDLTFTKVGSGVTIDPPIFSDADLITASAKKTPFGAIKSRFTVAKNK